MKKLQVEGWKVEKLGDVVEFQRGLTYSKKDEVAESSNVVLRANNVDLNTNTLDFTELKYIKESIEIPKEKIVTKGSLIICTASGSKSHLGKVALIDDNYGYAFGGFMGQITPKQNLDSKFLFYRMISDEYKDFISKLSDGANINNLRFNDLAEFEIPIPHLPEQQRIVSLLDETFAGLAQVHANAERNLVNAREVFEAAVEETFEGKANKKWQEKNFGDMFDIKHGFAFKSQYFSNKGKYVVLTPGNFYEEGGYRDRGEKTKYYKGEIPKDYILNEGDLLIAMTEQAAGLLGSPIIVPEPDKFLHNQRLGLIIYRNKDEIDARYLFHLFNTKRIRHLIHESASGVKVRHTSPTKVMMLNAHIPPLEEQRAIVKRLDALAAETSRLEAVYQSKLEAVEELRKSVLGKAFEGEL